MGMEGQARELEADGYAINLLLKNLLQSDNGSFITAVQLSGLTERGVVGP